MNVRAPSSRRIEISTGRKAAVPSGRTRPWIEQGTPSRNGITRTRSQRVRKNASARAWSALVAHPAHVVATAVEALAGVPGPDGAEGTRQPVGRGGERVAVGGHDLVRRPDDAGGVPDLVGQHLVLEGDERRGPAGEDRPAEDGLGRWSRTAPRPRRRGTRGRRPRSPPPRARGGVGRGGRGRASPRSRWSWRERPRRPPRSRRRAAWARPRARWRARARSPRPRAPTRRTRCAPRGSPARGRPAGRRTAPSAGR